MATYDQYGLPAKDPYETGLNNYQYLSPTQQTTARQIQDAFNTSQGSYGRQLERLSIPTSPYMVQEQLADKALRRAQVSANLMNQNQQLQDVIDASHRTPHGVAQNLSAYLPLLSGASNLIPLLFGRQGTAGVLDQGLVGLGKQAWNSFTHPGSGSQYGLDGNGNVVTNGFGGGQYQWPSDMGATDIGMQAPDMGFPTDISQVPVDPNGFGAVEDFGDVGDLGSFLG